MIRPGGLPVTMGRKRSQDGGRRKKKMHRGLSGGGRANQRGNGSQREKERKQQKKKNGGCDLPERGVPQQDGKKGRFTLTFSRRRNDPEEMKNGEGEELGRSTKGNHRCPGAARAIKGEELKNMGQRENQEQWAWRGKSLAIKKRVNAIGGGKKKKTEAIMKLLLSVGPRKKGKNSNVGGGGGERER